MLVLKGVSLALFQNNGTHVLDKAIIHNDYIFNCLIGDLLYVPVRKLVKYPLTHLKYEVTPFFMMLLFDSGIYKFGKFPNAILINTCSV